MHHSGKQPAQPISAQPDFDYNLDRSVIDSANSRSVSARSRTGAQRKKDNWTASGTRACKLGALRTLVLGYRNLLLFIGRIRATCLVQADLNYQELSGTIRDYTSCLLLLAEKEKSLDVAESTVAAVGCKTQMIGEVGSHECLDHQLTSWLLLLAAT